MTMTDRYVLVKPKRRDVGRFFTRSSVYAGLFDVHLPGKWENRGF